MRRFVQTNDPTTKLRVIADLELRGFTAENGDMQQILESRFPLKIDMVERTYGSMGNTTCAAAAASSGCLLTVEAFYRQYMGLDCFEQ